MPDEYIFQSEQEDLDWESICLPLHDLQIAMRRDTEKDVNRIRKQIKARHRWGFLGEPGKIVDKVSVHSITGNEDPYGVIAKIKLGKKVFHFPICDIEAIDT